MSLCLEDVSNKFVPDANRKPKIKNHIFRIFHSKSIFHYNLHMSIGPPLFQVDNRHKIDMCNEGKRVFFVKIHLESVIDIDTTDCNDNEVCIDLEKQTNLPVFADFLLSFPPLNKQDTSSDSSNTS